MKKVPLILLAALLFLLVRNLPLCLLMPLWAHGDEIGHFDYILKLTRGQIPQPTDLIESDLFLLHKVHYDSRYISKFRLRIHRPEELGLARYSYEAQQPPLSYAILGLFQKISLSLNAPMVLQVKLLRVVTLLATALGLVFLYLGLKGAKIQETYFYLPLLFIPLLVKEMFFSLNTDSFSFLFGCMAIMGAILLFKNPTSWKYWLWLSMGVVLAMWTKVTNGFLLVLCPLLAFFLWREVREKKVIRYAVIFFLVTLILSSPWYLYNLARFSNPFSSLHEVPFPKIPTQQLSFSAFKGFIYPFFITMFRGEFVWHGEHFHFITGFPSLLLFILLPLIIFLLGFLVFFFPFKGQNAPLNRFLILSGFMTLCAFCVAYFAVGGMPFYQARYAYGALYLLMFVFAAGWKRLSPASDWIFLIPMGGLFLYQAVYTAIILKNVF